MRWTHCDCIAACDDLLAVCRTICIFSVARGFGLAAMEYIEVQFAQPSQKVVILAPHVLPRPKVSGAPLVLSGSAGV